MASDGWSMYNNSLIHIVKHNTHNTHSITPSLQTRCPKSFICIGGVKSTNFVHDNLQIICIVKLKNNSDKEVKKIQICFNRIDII